MILKKIKIIVIVGVSLLSQTQFAWADFDFTHFTEDELDSVRQVKAIIPDHTELTMELVNDLFVGPEDLRGRNWELANFEDPERFREMLEQPFSVYALSSANNGSQLLADPFWVDSEGIIRVSLYLLPGTYIMVQDMRGEWGVDFSQMDCIEICVQAQLTPEELMIPVIQRVQMGLSFEEFDALKREVNTPKASPDLYEEGSEEFLTAVALHQRHFEDYVLPKTFITCQLCTDHLQRDNSMNLLMEMYESMRSE